MDSVHSAIFRSNDPLNVHEVPLVQSRLAHALSELSYLEDTLLKLSLVSAEVQRQREQVLETVKAIRGALSPIRAIPSEILAAIFLVCRDEDLKSPFPSIANPVQAPLVLTRVSARWRSVCHSTGNLWDHIRVCPLYLPPPAFVHQILMRSGALPLSIGLRTSDWSPGARVRKVLTALLQAQTRLQDIQLDVRFSDIPSAIWRKVPTFPFLSSTKILLRDADNVSLNAVDLATAAPSMRTVELSSNDPRTTLTEFALPSSSLTELTLHLDHIRVLFWTSQLQKCTLSLLRGSSDTNIPHTQQITRLSNLTHLDVEFDEDAEFSLPYFFQSLALPKLTHLSVHSVTWHAHIFPDLHQRSAFNLEELKLFNFDLSLYDVVPFLRLVQSLRNLHLECFGLGDPLEDFTSYSTTPSFILPHLRSLTLVDLGEEVGDDDWDPESRLQDHANAIFNLAESVSQTGGNVTFPALHSVTLSLQGVWPSDFEERLMELEYQLENLSYNSTVFSYTGRV
ncbi:hypothetical protein B0H14DRAFT_2714244 [Mycena olivaceomarginata]|nr:hypothetical protein B0H14DRAFT_2714244 [Mycena olivaceomarginata]